MLTLVLSGIGACDTKALLYTYNRVDKLGRRRYTIEIVNKQREREN